MTLIAVTRSVSPTIGQCELTHLARGPIDVDLARAQHQAYERALEAAGARIVRVEAAPDLPDAVFVEDIAIVFDEMAIVTRPGAASRRGEVAGVEATMARFRQLQHIEPPGMLDGGDVLVVGRTVYVGQTSRTNDAAVAQLRDRLAPFRYDVRPVAVHGCLHLKSAATRLDETRVLVNRAWIDAPSLSGVELVDVDPREPSAANVVRAGNDLVYPSAFPRTRGRLESLGFHVRSVDVSEIAKAEGAVTCCSLIFGDQGRR